MKIINSNITIYDILTMWDRNEIKINKTYQRSSGFWPISAQSYFIDTILEGFTFPKIYLYQNIDKNTRNLLKEIVDGQQRLYAIREFRENRLKLNSASRNYSGLLFSDLSSDKQDEFLMFNIPIDIILSASKAELLEMFRRINSYTTPLNYPEKRHARFQGAFKWFITELSDRYSATLQELNVLTEKQILRMSDAEFLSELCIVLDQGIIYKSNTSIDSLFKKYESEFPYEKKWMEIISDFFNILINEFKPLHSTYIMKNYVLNTLFTAMVHLKYNIPNGDIDLGTDSIGIFYINLNNTINELMKLAEAHELQDVDGEFGDYVKACLETTTKVNQRIKRTKYIIDALLNDE